MHPYFDVALPHLFAHRGASGLAPENTLLAFELGLASGVPYLEMDCHATRDGEIVICHDPELDRTTDGSGPIHELDFAQLEKLDAGYHFSPDGVSHPFRGKGLRIPRLAEVLGRFPGARINLEVKQAGPEIDAEVVRVVQSFRATQRVLLTAEDAAHLDAIRALDPGTALGSSFADALAFFAALDGDALDTFEPSGQALQIPASFGERELITPDVIAGAAQVGLFVHVWTINDPAEMRRLLSLGAHGVMSDFPGRLVEVARAFADE